MLPSNDSVHESMPNTWFNGNYGDSAITVRAKGCHFSVALYIWLPDSCLTKADFEDE
jgi:hypothetical protein